MGSCMKILTPVLAIIMAAVTTNAYALSCTRDGFDLAKVITANKKAGKNVTYVIGTFSGKHPNQIGTIQKQQKGTKRLKRLQTVSTDRSQTYTLKFAGKQVSKDAVKPLKTNVTVNSNCLSVWCGNAPKNNTPTIAILDIGASGKLTLNTGPCRPNIFKGGLETLRQLLN